MNSPLANPRETRAVLERFGLSAKHRLGQNFLVDDNVVGRILELSGLADGSGRGGAAAGAGVAGDDVGAGNGAAGNAAAPGRGAAPAGAKPDGLPCVVEVGPGIGTLTCALLRHARVVAVECDRDLPPVLAETCAADGERLRLVQADALKIDRAQLERACADMGAPLPGRLVANLPYQVAATLVLDWLERFEFIESMTVMVQGEVADRMAATCGNKDYGAYTVKLALRAHVAGRFHVAPSCFSPRPHVDSAVVRIERGAALAGAVAPAKAGSADAGLARAAAAPATVDAACELADAAFCMRRKTIRNSMKSRYDAAVVDAVLAACGIDPGVRAETLPPAAYLRMACALEKL